MHKPKVPGPEISRLANAWSVRLVERLPWSSCSEVWGGVWDDGREVVLKVADDHAEEKGSIATLLAFAGHGGVEILRHDDQCGGILMPRLRPGTTLGESGLSDHEALEVCVDCTLKLRQAPATAALAPTDWFSKFLENGPDNAVRVCRHLIDTTTRWTLLHGDLHHGNILRHGDEWMVIDPKGIWGDPAFEPTAFLRNPIDEMLVDPDPAARSARRIEMFAERLHEPVERIWGWAYAQTSECAFAASGSRLEAWRRMTDALAEIGKPYRKQLGL